ncbi:MAG TPA: tRNA (adenosine(37)-N6)-threonylcarbamoyltransferase complex dimerization subunit type 1 TsaB [Halanaerobiales bacterium]|nr:tRNA (adenosine(37)-N6)-threonylcarbamoyltransferase complex dimerization subunit type 1 TsaB [Halanaerobiales bacterium]HPZ63184.1 tRNA (adenosine(37)-N6)-threonylcarbamoyltransferase complex dimerization subunit type 1 TsaB [Halanaerobiales bacterium]
MLTLGIDTSTEICALGLADEVGILGEINFRLINRHGEELHSNLDFLLSSTGKKISDLEGLCIGTGPGSFTGLRIGLTAARTLAQVRELPIVGVSSLDLLAYNLSSTGAWLVPVIDARRQRVYTALYRGWDQDIAGQRIDAARAVGLEELLAELQILDPEGVFYFAGNGVNSYQSLLADSALNIKLASADKNIIRGGVVAALGQYYLAQGRRDNYLELAPDYLKKPQAEINWQKIDR